MKTLDEQWTEFYAACFPRDDANDIQKNEMKRAFISGAFIAYGAVFEIIDSNIHLPVQEATAKNVTALLERYNEASKEIESMIAEEKAHGAKADKDGCEEQAVKLVYFPCNQPAVKLVHHEKDKRTYRMCEQHAWHNIKNRNGEDKGEYIPCK